MNKGGFLCLLVLEEKEDAALRDAFKLISLRRQVRLAINGFDFLSGVM